MNHKLQMKTSDKLINQFNLRKIGFFYLGQLPNWADVHSVLSPLMQSGPFEPLGWYFIEDKVGGWKDLFGTTFWSRGAWIIKDEPVLVIYAQGALTLRPFDSQEDLHDALG